MATVRALAGRRPQRPRRLAVRDALVAAGVAPAPLLPTYDMQRGSAAERYFYEQALADGLAVFDRDVWPTEAAFEWKTDAPPLVLEGNSAVYEVGGALAYVEVAHGWAAVSVASNSAAAVVAAMAAFRAQYPASYAVSQDGLVPVTFWTDGRFGPTARLRRIDASPWEPIQANYTAAVSGELAELMGWGSGPERDGQLLVWLGEPGTGKTWALRALVSEWSPWAEFHYITDPDAFFVDNPSYMVDVLLADSYEAIDPGTGDLVTEQNPGGKWRILILEDTGELLSANAKEKYGQGLSRLLNVVDGMIGQGLRVLALVTTNDQLSDFHPAVTRPGRCASLLTFGPLSNEEAKAWTGNPEAVGGTLAELYAQRGSGAEAFDAEEEGLTAAADDVAAEIARVAEDRNPTAVDNGQTAWNADTKTVLWVASDSTANDELDAARDAFLAIDGVENFDYEAEAMPDGWCDASVVYGGNPFKQACAERAKEAAAYEEALVLARAPLEIGEALGHDSEPPGSD